ncbi:hypothetical protein DV738_g2839, partial [Chaetothyriales sp. CBS 135597]
MNQDELAALLAVTHGSVTHASMTPPSRLKPDQPGLKAPKPTELSYQRDTASRLPRVGVLRDGDEVHPPPRPSTTVRSRGFQTLSGHRQPGKLTRSPGRRKSTENTCVPDFVVEERAAWNESPNKISRGRTGISSTQPSRRKSVSPSIFRSSRPRQPSPAPTRETTKKIKSSRGAKTERSDEDPEPGVGKDTNIIHKAKFNEGSMSERSAGVSSTWQQFGARLSESSDVNNGNLDADSPFRPGRTSRDTRGSLDVSEFLPPTTPSTIKRTLAKLGGHFKSSADDSFLSTNEPKQPRRGLRKSLSSWNLHLGEKMHFFGTSTQDLGNPRSTTPVKKQTVADTELLDDRKRKAEAAYAEQFGTKKQKGNDGQATGPETASPDRRMVTSSARRRHASPARLSHHGLDPAEIMGGGDVERRKKLTRRELELENQQLRALLRERDAKRTADPSSDSKPGACPLPEDKRASSMPQASTSTATAPRPAVPVAPTRRQHKQRPGHDVPPVPPLPSRMVLATLVAGSNGAGSKHGPVDLPTKPRASGEIPRSISTIMEDDENVPSLGSDVLPGLQPSSKNDEWQWPDDVF